MEQCVVSALPTEEDYRRYEKIWRRVSPGEDPYPRQYKTNGAGGTHGQGGSALAALPEADACCIDLLSAEVVQGFLREEMADQGIYRSLARRAPHASERQTLFGFAHASAESVKLLQTIHFLITGETYQVTVVLPPQPKLYWCDALRARYHAESCKGFNTLRAAEETNDSCLKKLFIHLSEEACRRAETLCAMLSRAL